MVLSSFFFLGGGASFRGPGTGVHPGVTRGQRRGGRSPHDGVRGKAKTSLHRPVASWQIQNGDRTACMQTS